MSLSDPAYTGHVTAREYREQLAADMTEKQLQEQIRALAAALGWAASRADRFIAKIDASDSCWLWTASKKQNGYGQFNDGRRHWNVHRVVYMAAIGPIPAGYEIDHLCAVRHCVRPDHLEAVTPAENKRRAGVRVTHCPAGHEYNQQNTYLWRGYRACRPCRIERARRRRSGGAR